ncbi:hypothetical protein HPB48_010354 [Haemaphysalis longicornis]|uniref:Uncharacterized protein n=1 Tax=Haemaphysalis longicornis TaxID=44386 RepID=A0A9J6GLQ8_HAELO|nr:hypothetical protein HPB48_010354 [Haemaphysalis longicornis]
MHDLEEAKINCQRLVSKLQASEQEQEKLQTELQAFNADSQQLSLNIEALEKQKQQLEVTEDSLRNNDAKVLVYTGIAILALMIAIFQLIAVVVKHTSQNIVAKFKEFLFLLKLK